MSFALPRVVRLGPLVGHLRDRRVIRSADKKCLRPRHVVGILYRPWVLAAAMSRSRSQRACHHGRLCPRREVRVWCLKDPGRPSLGARPVGGDHRESHSGTSCCLGWARNLQPASLPSIQQYTALHTSFTEYAHSPASVSSGQP